MPARLFRFSVMFLPLLVCAGCARALPEAAPTAVSSRPASATPVAPATPVPTSTAAPTPTANPTATPTATLTPEPTATSAPTATPAATACGETHGRVEHLSLHSAAMGRDETFRLYLPPCYARQAFRRYPAVYLLHGGEHNEEHWDDVGVDEAADAAIADGTLPPLLIVLPDGGQDFGPLRGNPPPFARYLRDELIPHVDATYRTLADRDHRALGGISYGAAWALLLAARYVDTFVAVGAHSPAIGSFNGIYPDAKALAAGKLRIYVDVGDRDGLRRPAAAFVDSLKQAGATPEFHVYSGGHLEAYWNGHLKQYLHFYAQSW